MNTEYEFIKCNMKSGTIQYDSCHYPDKRRIAELEEIIKRLRYELRCRNVTPPSGEESDASQLNVPAPTQ